MNDQLVHIFDNSTCLTKRQLKDYVTGVMGDEECHAAEVHLNSCPFCSDAVDGMLMHKDEAARLLADLNPDFLKEHFTQAMPQVHLNAIAVPAAAEHHPTAGRKKHNTRPLWRTASVAAAILFCTAVVWYYQSRQKAYQDEHIAQELPVNTGTKPATLPEQKIIASTDVIPQTGRKEPAASAIVSSDTQQPIALQEDTRAGDKTVAANTQETAPVNAAINKDEHVAAPPVQPAATSRQAGPNDARPYYGNALNRNSYSGSAYQNYNTAPADQYRLKQDAAPSLSKRAAKPLVVSAQKEELQNAPANNINDIAATSTGTYQSKPGGDLNIGGARTEGTKYVVDGVEAKKKAVVTETEADGDELYDQKNYRAALVAYNKDVDHANRARRHYAMIGAARCYMNMDQKAKAKQLLQRIVDEGGAQSRQARKMLRNMGSDAQ